MGVCYTLMQPSAKRFIELGKMVSLDGESPRYQVSGEHITRFLIEGFRLGEAKFELHSDTSNSPLDEVDEGEWAEVCYIVDDD